MNQLTSLNIYSNNSNNQRNRHELFFQKTLKTPQTKSAFAMFLRAIYLFDRENNFETPMEIKKLILETILDVKYKDFNAKILDLSTKICEKWLASKGDSIVLDNDDILNKSCKIFSKIVTDKENLTNSFCFMTDQKSAKRAKDANTLFPIKT